MTWTATAFATQPRPGWADWLIYSDLDNDSQFDLAGHVEPDELPDSGDIDDLVRGVTLSAVMDGAADANVTTTGPTAFTSTGLYVFWNSVGDIWAGDERKLRADFAQPVSIVSIDFIAVDQPAFGRLEVYDANDTLLETYDSQTLSQMETATLRVIRPQADIAYMLAFGESGPGGFLDNLVFGKLSGGIEPDDRAQGTQLNTVSPGVTLSAIGSNVTTDTVTVDADSNSSTGTRVFDNDWQNGPIWVENQAELRVDFATPVTRASIDFISDDSSDIGQLEAYDADDNLLATYITADLSTGQSETMLIERPAAEIAYFLAFGQGGQTGRLDNLQFDVEASTEPFALTIAGGAYLIDQAPLGIQTIREFQQDGWKQTFPIAGGHTVNITPSDTLASGRDFGNVEPIRIEGVKWHDQNSDGVQNNGEPALPGWFVYLDSNNNGEFDIGEPSTTTDDNGAYAFDDLTPNGATTVFHVAEFLRPRWRQTFPDSTIVDQSQLAGTITNAVHVNISPGQTFTVGQAGRLNAIELSLGGNASGADDLTLTLFDNTAGDPLTAPVIGVIPIPQAEFGPAPLALDADNVTASLIDLSHLELDVEVGDNLAIQLSTARVLPNFFSVRRHINDLYAGGRYFTQNGLGSGDMMFKVFVDAAADKATSHTVTASPGETVTAVDFGNVTDNLVQNGGGEEPLVSGQIPFWTEVSGSNWGYGTTNPIPDEGQNYFSAGTAPDGVAELSQDVDLLTYESTINAGTQRFLFQALTQSLLTIPSDRARFIVEYRDAGGVLDSFDSGFLAGLLSWRLVSDERLAPPGTEFARIRFQSDPGFGISATAYADNFIFVASDVLGPIAQLETAATTVNAGEVVQFDASSSRAWHAGIRYRRLRVGFRLRRIDIRCRRRRTDVESHIFRGPIANGRRAGARQPGTGGARYRDSTYQRQCHHRWATSPLQQFNDYAARSQRRNAVASHRRWKRSHLRSRRRAGRNPVGRRASRR